MNIELIDEEKKLLWESMEGIVRRIKIKELFTKTSTLDEQSEEVNRKVWETIEVFKKDGFEDIFKKYL